MSLERLDRNCWAKEHGQEAMAAGVVASKVGASAIKDSWMSVGEKYEVLRVLGSNRAAVSVRSWWKTA